VIEALAAALTGRFQPGPVVGACVKAAAFPPTVLADARLSELAATAQGDPLKPLLIPKDSIPRIRIRPSFAGTGMSGLLGDQLPGGRPPHPSTVSL